MQTHTYKAKDVPDGGNENNHGICASQQEHSDGSVANPAESLRRAQEVVDSGTNLHNKRDTGRLFYMTYYL